jgi:hypothetical protein
VDFRRRKDIDAARIDALLRECIVTTAAGKTSS